MISEKWDIRFLRLAELVSSWSLDPSTKVGAVIALEKRLVSIGFNGFPSGMDDDPNLYLNREEKISRIIHGEINALLFAKNVLNCTLYTFPMPPCERCCVQFLQ